MTFALQGSFVGTAEHQQRAEDLFKNDNVRRTCAFAITISKAASLCEPAVCDHAA